MSDDPLDEMNEFVQRNEGRRPAAKICPIMSYRSNPPVAVDCVRERCAAWCWPFLEGEYGPGYCKLIGPGRQV